MSSEKLKFAPESARIAMVKPFSVGAKYASQFVTTAIAAWGCIATAAVTAALPFATTHRGSIRPTKPSVCASWQLCCGRRDEFARGSDCAVRRTSLSGYRDRLWSSPTMMMVIKHTDSPLPLCCKNRAERTYRCSLTKSTASSSEFACMVQKFC